MAMIILKDHDITGRDASNVALYLKAFCIQSRMIDDGTPVYLLDLIQYLDNRTANVVRRIPMVERLKIDWFVQMYDKTSFMNIKGAGLKSYATLKTIINSYGYDW